MFFCPTEIWTIQSYVDFEIVHQKKIKVHQSRGNYELTQFSSFTVTSLEVLPASQLMQSPLPSSRTRSTSLPSTSFTSELDLSSLLTSASLDSRTPESASHEPFGNFTYVPSSDRTLPSSISSDPVRSPLASAPI